MHSTPGSEFEPYFERARKGDLGALVEYCRDSLDPSDSAYFECLGFMAVCGSNRQRLTVQRIMRAKRWSGREIKAQIHEYWKDKLTPLAETASEWIKERRNEKMDREGLLPSRNELWKEYLDNSTLLTSSSSDEKRVLLSGKRTEGVRKAQAVFPTPYTNRGLVPKQLFWLLAETGATLSEAIRKYIAGDPLNVSWSNPSRIKSLRRN